MSTARDMSQSNGAIDLGDGITATPNSDGTYTVTGGSADENGVYTPVAEGTEGAIQIENTGTQFDGSWWLKQ